MMSRSHQPSWIRQMLLLSALGAGALTTLLVPPYRDVALLPEDEQPAASTASPGGTSQGMSGVDVDLHHLNFVRKTI
jgi:hypothetical protein